MTEDLQQQSVWCLSGCFSPVNTSKQVSAKLSDSWVTLHRSEPTHRWQQPGQELRPQGNYTAGRAVCVRNAELKGSSSRYCRFPRKGSKYQKHETREKGSERQELHPAEWEACCRVQNQSRELEGQEEWAFTSHRWMKRWSVTWAVVFHHSQCDSFSIKLWIISTSAPRGRIPVWGC